MSWVGGRGQALCADGSGRRRWLDRPADSYRAGAGVQQDLRGHQANAIAREFDRNARKARADQRLGAGPFDSVGLNQTPVDFRRPIRKVRCHLHAARDCGVTGDAGMEGSEPAQEIARCDPRGRHFELRCGRYRVARRGAIPIQDSLGGDVRLRRLQHHVFQFQP